MAKNFPYFKFVATTWLTGNIAFEELELQGLYINICALYWQRDGKLKLNDIKKRYKKENLITSLIPAYFTVNSKTDFISINFLDQQLREKGALSETNSTNGKKGGRPKGAKNKEKKPGEKLQQQSTSNYISTNLIDIWFKDLENCSELEIISRVHNIDVNWLKNKIPDFKKKAELEYPNGWKDFIKHFKNYINLELKNNESGNTKKGNNNGGYNAEGLSALNSAIKGLPDGN